MFLMDSLRKSLVLTSLRQRQSCVSVHITMVIIVFLLVNRKEIYNFKAHNESINFPTQFCLESIYNGFDFVWNHQIS